jgi:hypothetical protein
MSWKTMPNHFKRIGESVTRSLSLSEKDSEETASNPLFVND